MRRAAPTVAVLGALLGFWATSASSNTIAHSRYARAVLVDKPLAYWRLDDRPRSRTLADASGHGAVLRPARHTILWVGGSLYPEADAAIEGRGVLATGPAGNPPAVVEFWIAVAATPTRPVSVYTYSRDGGTNAGRDVVLRPDGFVQADDRRGRKQLVAVGPASVDGGDWHYVVADFAHHVVHVDLEGYEGVAPAPAIPEPWSPSRCRARCGRPLQLVGSRGFSGYVDELALYDHPLPFSRLAAHGTAGGQSVSLAAHDQFDGTVKETKRPPASAVPMTPLGPAAPGTYATAVLGPSYPRPLRAVVSTAPGTFSLTGRVMDMTTAAAVPDAQVTIGRDCLGCLGNVLPTALATSTSSTGAFAFTGLDAPTRTTVQLLTVDARGYGSLAFTVETRAGVAYVATVFLGFGGGWREEAPVFPTRRASLVLRPEAVPDQLAARLYPPGLPRRTVSYAAADPVDQAVIALTAK